MRRTLVAVVAVLLGVALVGHAGAGEDERRFTLVESGEGYWSVAGRLAAGCSAAQVNQLALTLQARNSAKQLYVGSFVDYLESDLPVCVPTTTTTNSTTTTAPTTTTTTVASTGGFPTRTTVGTPAGWQPTRTITGSYTIRTAGTVIEDVRFLNAQVEVAAANVTFRRVEFAGSYVHNWRTASCNNGMVIEDSTFRPPPSGLMDWDPVVQEGGYTARRVLFDNLPEGFRVSGVGNRGCDPVVIEDSFLHVESPPDCTNNQDWHGDGIQGYYGVPVTVRNVAIEMVERKPCGGTAPFFYPRNQGNTSVEIDGLLVKGGGYPFRLGTSGTVRNLNIVDGSWTYAPIDVNCPAVSVWDAWIVRLDSAGQPVRLRAQPCNTNGGI